jgi:hypothetical protein
MDIGDSSDGSRLRRVAGRLALALTALAAPLMAPLVSVPPAHAAGAPVQTSPGPSSSGVNPPNFGSSASNGTEGKVAGMAIPNVNQQQSPDEVTRLRSDGLNTISLFVWWVMKKQDSNTVDPDYNDSITESDANLELQMASSVHAGMHVILVPLFYCLSCEGGWRGTIAPSDPTAWWQSYRSFIDHYAQLAQQNGVTTFFVGSEMTSMEQDTSQWKTLIAEERTRFTGQIGYEENWDVLGQAGFLSDTDVIGVSAYFPLDDTSSPALPDILTDWTDSHASATAGKNWVAKLSALAASTGRPILFGEVGYMSGDHAGRQPFLNYQDTINWQLQSDLYQALLETFENKSWWAGVVWWEWYLTSDTTSDNDRSPRGKTAEQLLRDWYGKGERPPDDATPLIYSLPQYSPDDAEVPRSAPAAASGSSPSASPGSNSSATGGSGARPGPRSGPVRSARAATGGHRGSAGPAAAAGVAAGSSSPRATRATRTGSGRTTEILASVALVIVIAALALVGALRRPRPTA